MLPPDVEDLDITCPVYDKAAYKHAKIKTLTFNASAELSIGLYAFAQTAVSSVIIANATKVNINECAFQQCTALEAVKLGNVGLLDTGAFYGCTKLETLQLPADIDTSRLGANIFRGCTGLKHLQIPAPLTAYIEKRNVEDVEFLSGTAVNSGAFRECTLLRSVKLADTITEIGAQAFYGCSQLRAIDLNNITEYGFLLTASVNCPPSSYPTYPGGEPINLDVEWLSIYSDISTLIILSSLPNIS